MYRHFKQLLYGFGYLLFWLAVGSLVYFVYFRPAPSCFDNIQNQGEQGIDCGGPCQKICLPASLKPLQVIGDVKIFYPQKGSLSLLVQIQNPNLNYGANNFSYSFKIYDYSNNLLEAVENTSFIYAGEIKYLAIPNFNFSDTDKISRVDLVINEPQWVKTENFSKPGLNIQNQTTALKSNQLEVDGRLVNNDNISFSAVTVLAIFYGQFGQADGVSQGEIENLAPGEVRQFTVVHPMIAGVDITKTQVFVFTKRP